MRYQLIPLTNASALSFAEKSAKSLYLAAMKSLDLDNVSEPVTRGVAAKYLA